MSLPATPPLHRSRSTSCSSSEEFWPIHHDVNGRRQDTPPATPILKSVSEFSSKSKTTPQSSRTSMSANTPTPVTPKKNLDSQGWMPPTPMSMRKPYVSDGLGDKESVKYDDVGLPTVRAPKKRDNENNIAIVLWWDTHVLGVRCPFCLDIETQTVTQFSTEDPFLVIRKQIDIRTANCEKSRAYRILYPDEEHPAVEEVGWKWSAQNKRYETAGLENVCAKDCQLVTDGAGLADISEWEEFGVYQSIENGQVGEEGDMQTTSPGIENVEKIVGTEVITIDDTEGDDDEVWDASTDEIDQSQEVGLDAEDHSETIVVDTRQIPKTLRFEKDPAADFERLLEREDVDNSENITEPIIPQLPRRAPCKPSKPISKPPPAYITLRHDNFAVAYTPSAIVPVTGAYSKTVGFLAPIHPFAPRIFTRSGWTNQDFTPDDISHLQSTLIIPGAGVGADIPTYKIINNCKYTGKVRDWCLRLDFPLKRDNMDYYSREGQFYATHVEKQLIVFALEEYLGEYQTISRFRPCHPSSPETLISRTMHINRDPCTDCRAFAAKVEAVTPLRFIFETMTPVTSREQSEALKRRKLAKKPKTKMAKRSRGVLEDGDSDDASSASLENGTKCAGSPGVKRVKRARKSSRENAEADLQNGYGWDDESDLGISEFFIDDEVGENTTEAAVQDDDENDFSDIIDSQGEYEVAAVIGKERTFNGAVRYCVRWKDMWLTDEQVEHERAKMKEEEGFAIVERRMTKGGEIRNLVTWDDCWKVAGGLPRAKKLIKEFEECLLEKEKVVDA